MKKVCDPVRAASWTPGRKMIKHIAVLGGGIVGACVAAALIEEGHRVTLVEPGPVGGEQAASFGNGAWISPASVVPMSMPGTWRKVPGYLLDPTGPLTIRWRCLPRLLPWMVRFLAAGFTEKKVERTARALSSLLANAPDLHRQLAQKIGRTEMVESCGLLYAYPNRRAFELEELAWRLRKQNGVTWVEVGAEALRRLVPSLGPQYEFAAFVRAGSFCTDPGSYVASIVDHVMQCGGRSIQAKATGFIVERGRLKAVKTDRGTLDCDTAIIAAGVYSKALASACGDSVLIESERGYHVVIPSLDAAPSIPVMTSDSKSANTPTRTGFRIAGQVEIASVNAAPNWRRSEILLQQAVKAYPSLREKTEYTNTTRWMGHRPSTPDGLPVICRSAASGDIIHAFGHGHIGLAAGPATALLVADLVAGRSSAIDIAPFSLRRFRWRVAIAR